MSRREVNIDSDGVRIAGITADATLTGGPLIIAVHGGSYTSAYFDISGHSLIERASRNGMRVIALDRPCYGNSDALAPDDVTFARNAKVLDAAIARLWEEYGDRHQGVVLVGHSIGGAICVHLASRAVRWPLLGMSISGIHDIAPAEGRGPQAPLVRPYLDFPPEWRRMVMYGPDWTMEDDILRRAETSAAPIPRGEILEVAGPWPREAASLAAKVTAPVQYIAFEFDHLWSIDPASVRAFAGHFTGAAVITSELMAGTGHSADHHRNSDAFHLRQLSFALDCAHRVARPTES